MNVVIVHVFAFALHEATFQEFELLAEAESLWALTEFVVLASIVVHGVTATPVMNWVDRVQ